MIDPSLHAAVDFGPNMAMFLKSGKRKEQSIEPKGIPDRLLPAM